MATNVKFKYFEVLWIISVVCCIVLVQGRSKNENSLAGASLDPSDQTLVRVLRSEFEEEERQEEGHSKKVPAVARVHKTSHLPHVKKRASEEDQFFQALLSRANEKSVEKRSYESQPEKDDVRTNWKGDSKISDADRSELEHLFNSIGMVEDTGSKTKIDAKRALTKTGVDGKVQELVEWLMSKPPKEFHESLRKIIDVEKEVSDLFTVVPGESTTSSVVNADDPTTTTETVTTTETTSPVTTTVTGQPPETVSVSPPVSVSAGVTPPPTAIPTQTMSTPYPMAQAINAFPQQTVVLKDAKNPGDVYADTLQAAKTMSHTGPGPIPQDAMDYFNKFSGGVNSLTPQMLTNYGVHPNELRPQVPQGAGALPQQAPAVAPQGMAAQQSQQQQQQQQPRQQQLQQQQQQQQQQQRQQQQQQQAQYADQNRQAGYGAQYPATAAQNNARQNPYYTQYDQRQQALGYPKPYRPRGPGYTPPPQRPYPMNRDELDEPTDKKNAVQATLLFKQNWSENFLDKDSTSSRVFRGELKKHLTKVFSHAKVKKIHLDKLREDRGKVGVTFTVFFSKKTTKPLQPLYGEIQNDNLLGMSVYRDTLRRTGKAHLTSVRQKSTTMDMSQSENPATEFAKFADDVDREKTGQNLPLNERHNAYQGCFKDHKPNRDMRKHFSKFEMTPDWCLHTCKREGFRFAGVQYSYLCFCGNKYGRYGRVADTECNSRCYGDKDRFCGSFWHNSIYAVDGRHHDLDEFTAIPDDPDEEEEESKDKEKDKDEDNKEDEKQHAEVANHLMKAASSALKAAKKLLPAKNKHQATKELAKHKRDAEESLEAVDNIVKSTKKVEKRSVESSDGRNLLMAYLGNVGGYDRVYRSAEDEDKPVDKIKFDYKRMIIDEEGDGEFITKQRQQKYLRRNRRSLETEEYDGRKKMASRAIEESSDATNPKAAVVEPSRRELLSHDSDKEITRRSRDTDEEEEEAEQEKEKTKTRKRSVGFEKSLYHTKVVDGVETAIGGVVDVMKGISTMSLFKDAVDKLGTDVMGGLAVPAEQKDQVITEVRADIKETGLNRFNTLVASIRTELNEYGEMHPAVGPQADEAAKTFADIPLEQSQADAIKGKIRKRSADEDSEKSFLSDILKEHFKQNK